MIAVVRVSKDLVNWEPIECDWLAEQEIPGDPLEDTAPDNNSLSVFVLEDLDRDIYRLAAAFTTTRLSFRDFYYIVFDMDIIHKLNISIDPKTEANTADSEVNKWHLDLINLSAQKVALLTQEIFNTKSWGLIYEDDVKDLVIESCKNQWIDLDSKNIKPEIKKKITTLLKDKSS